MSCGAIYLSHEVARVGNTETNGCLGPESELQTIAFLSDWLEIWGMGVTSLSRNGADIPLAVHVAPMAQFFSHRLHSCFPGLWDCIQTHASQGRGDVVGTPPKLDINHRMDTDN